MDARLNDEAVENLVTQFSSSLDFYRELVQNSIDAGSSSVEVWMEFEPGEGLEGVVSIHVDDFGEGMNEEIIDDQLTKLFSSTKENDLTKIGKFGIGFVSVFALRPAGVLVRTGRDGECWEIFFHEDRSFTKARLKVPVEGTQITMFLSGDRARYRELVEGTRAALEKWCAHSDTEISFEDRTPSDARGGGVESINEPFEVDSSCRAHVRHPGTELSVGFSDRPRYGFYNKGLALAVSSAGNDILEGRASRFAHISFKIKSRYLEHTLSRETVMRDENYEKAMGMLEDAVERELRGVLTEQLETLCTAERWSLARRARYRTLMGYLAAEPRNAFGPLGPRKVLRTVEGEPRPMQDALEALQRDGRVLVAPAPSKLTAQLATEGIPVFLGGVARGDTEALDPIQVVIGAYLAAQTRLGVIGFLREATGANLHDTMLAKLSHPESVMVSVTVAEHLSPHEDALLRASAEVLSATGMGYASIVGGRIEGRPEAPRLFAMGRTLTSVMAIPPRGTYARVPLLERPRVVVNLGHPHFVELRSLYAEEPAIATYCLAKAMLLEEDRRLDRDLDLMRAAGVGGR